LAFKLRAYLGDNPPEGDLKAYIKLKLIGEGLGVWDASDKEVEHIAKHSDPLSASYALADIVSRRAQSGWTTHGHSGMHPVLSFSIPLLRQC
jgi:alkaline phosphatase